MAKCLTSQTLCENRFTCTLIMSWNMSDEKVCIRIERGSKPRLKIDETGRNIHAIIPKDTSVNWPAINAEVPGGYVISIQRLQQQYKISLQHMHEKKPEIVIYSSLSPHDNELKTTVKDMNTQIREIAIGGPNLDIVGNIKAQSVTFESTIGTMHINARILSTRLILLAQNIVVATESLLSTSKLRVISRKMQLDGRIYPHETSQEPRHLCVVVNSSLLHLGVDGCIGESNEKEKNKSNKKTLSLNASKIAQIVADTLSLQISGSLANYGRIISTNRTELKIGESLLSLMDGSIDSAGRGYDALKEIRGIRSKTSCLPSTASLQNAITSQNADAAAHLIENGVDLNDKVHNIKKTSLTLRQEAIRKYREKKEESMLNQKRANITLINALFTVHDWKRGIISSEAILAVIGKRCDDCAQLSSKELQMKIGSSATVEKDSIWNCSWVELEVGNDVTIAGQVKHKTFIINSEGTIRVTESAIINHEIFARITSKSFDCDGIWSVGETFAVDASRSISFYSNSYIESEKMEIASEGNVSHKGSWQIGSLWLKAANTFELGESGKVLVEENTSIEANIMKSYGFLNSSEDCHIQVKDKIDFYPSSKLECRNYTLTCEGNCTLAGIWVVDQMNIYVRKDLITLEGGKSATFSKATVTAGYFLNQAFWQVEKNGMFTIGKIEQTSDATIFVKQSFDLVLHSDSSCNWDGRIVCSHFLLRCLKACRFDGFLRANEAEVTVPYSGESQLHATGQWDILSSPLTIKGNSCFLPSTPRKRHSFPAFILSGRLSATAIIAPFSSIQISEDAILRLIGITSPNPDIEFNTLIACGSLTTLKGSTIVSLAKNPQMEGIICAETWYHEGQIRFQAEEVHLLANSWIQKGRLTTSENKQNHVKSLQIVIEELLLNKGTLACDYLYVMGEGTLENLGRIFASENMDIRLKNFNNDEGFMESKNKMKLLSASNDWVRLGGSIKAKTNLDLCAHKLELAVKDASSLLRGGRISFSARSDLLLATSIVDENRQLSLGCAAQRSVTLNSTIDIDRLEILLGGPQTDIALLHLREAADVLVNNLVITGSAKELRIFLDGTLRCGRLSVSSGFEKVIVACKNQLEVNTFQAEKSDVAFDLHQIVALGDITASSIEIMPDAIFRLRAFGEADATTILTSALYIHGNLLVEGKLFISAIKGSDVFISGSIVGSSPESEICIEGVKVKMTGLVASLKFLEIFAKESLTVTNGKFKNINGTAIESSELHLNADIEDCFQCVINGEIATVSGNYSSTSQSDTFSLFSSTVHSSVNFSNMNNVSFGCSRTAVISGKFENVMKLDLDAKWLMIGSSKLSCQELNCSAWSLHIKSKIEAEKVQLSSLGVIILMSEIDASNINLVALFVLSMTKPLPSCSVHSLVLMTTLMNSAPSGLSYLHFMFAENDESSKIAPSDITSWKETASMMKDRFNCPTIDVDELLLGLKYLNDLKPTRITLNENCSMYREIGKMMAKFEKSPINVFSAADLVTIIYNARTSIMPNAPERIPDKKKKNKYESTLYSTLCSFRSNKYGKETRGSSDSDGGYASRSSSEDLDVKDMSKLSISPARTSTPSLFVTNHMEEIHRKLEEVHNSKPAGPEEISESFVEEEDEELSEFEELEHEIENVGNGVIQTNFIICQNQVIQLASLKQKTSVCLTNIPKTLFPILRASSSNDLVMKRIKVKNALSSLDLRSFGSELSLLSLDFSKAPDVGSPIHYPSSPLQRSRIPRGSFRSPQKTTLCK